MKTEGKYLFTTIVDGKYSRLVPIDDVHFVMPTLIAPYMERYKVKLSEINKIVDLIY